MKKMRKILCIALSLVMLGLIIPNTTTFAAAGNATEVNTMWTRIYPASSNTLREPINGYVTVYTTNLGSTHLDVRMIGKDESGKLTKIVWSECCAVDCNQHRTFWCGKDVYYIEARSHYSGINFTNKLIAVQAIFK